MADIKITDPLGVEREYSTSKVGFNPVSGSELAVFQEGGGGGHDYATEALLLEDRGMQGDYFNPDVRELASAMSNNNRLTGISLPNCESLPGWAFFSCSNLVFADFPVCKVIVNSAFANCQKLSRLAFPAAEIIGDNVFNNVGSTLTSLVLASTLKYVGDENFYGKSRLLSNYNGIAYFGTAVVQSNWASAGNYVNGSIISLRPDTTTLGKNAFNSRYNSSVTGIENTENVKYINDCAFSQCSKLSFSDRAFPNCISVGFSAFTSCILQSEDNIGYVGDMAVKMYSSASMFSLRENTRVIAASLFSFYGNSRLTAIEGIETVQHIGDYAFYGCSNLSNWGSYDLSALVTIGDYAFRNARVPSIINLANCEELGVGAFAGCYSGGSKQLTTGPNVSHIPASAFAQCSLVEINLPACARIDAYAFRSNTYLTTVSLPECLRVGSEAFKYAFSLASIELPVCQEIFSGAFQSCSKLRSVYFPGSKVVWLETDNVFPYSFWTSGRVYVPESLVSKYKADLIWGLHSSRIYGITE